MTTTITQRARFCAPALFKHDVTIEGTLRYRHLKGMDCGLFTNLESLCLAFPTPAVGMYAFVVNPDDATVLLLYGCRQQGEWTLIRNDAKLDLLDTTLYQQTLDIIDNLSQAGHALSGFIPLTDVSQLPDRPLSPTTAYLISGHLFLYVGTGGDVADGRYQDCGPLRGEKGETGTPGRDGDPGVVLDGVNLFSDVADIRAMTPEQRTNGYVPNAAAVETVREEALEAAVCEAKAHLTQNIVPVGVERGVYINADGEETTSISYDTYVYAVQRGFCAIDVTGSIGSSAYITLYNRDGEVLSRYKGGGSSPTYAFDKTVFIERDAVLMKIPIIRSGTTPFTVTDSVRGSYANITFEGEVAHLLDVEIPKRQGYLNQDGEWTKAISYFHYVIPLAKEVDTVLLQNNDTSPAAYTFLKSYEAAMPYETNNQGNRPTYQYAENYKGSYIEMEVGQTVAVSVPRDAAYLYLSATANRRPLSLQLLRGHTQERVTGLRLAPTSATHGHYIDLNGVVQESAATCLFEYDVTGITHVYVKGRVASLSLIVFADINGDTVAKVRRQWVVSGINTDAVYAVPAGAVTMKVSAAVNYTLVVSDVSEKEKVSRDNQFSTKRVAFLGDSITAGVGATQDYKRYSSVFCSLARCYEVNLGMNGTCLAANTKNGKTADRFITRATQDNIGNADVIFVFGGTNDFTYDVKPIGPLFDEQTITATTYRGTKKRVAPSDNETFAGALHELILHIRSVNPTARLIFLTALNRGVWHKQSTPPSSAESNANGDYQQDFNAAIKTICHFYAIPVVDMTVLFNQDFTQDNADATPPAFSPYDDDGIHPNDAGHERIARVLYRHCSLNIEL